MSYYEARHHDNAGDAAGPVFLMCSLGGPIYMHAYFQVKDSWEGHLLVDSVCTGMRLFFVTIHFVNRIKNICLQLSQWHSNVLISSGHWTKEHASLQIKETLDSIQSL